MDISTPPLHVMTLVFGMDTNDIWHHVVFTRFLGLMTYGIHRHLLGHMASKWVSQGFRITHVLAGMKLLGGLAQWMSQRLAL